MQLIEHKIRRNTLEHNPLTRRENRIYKKPVYVQTNIPTNAAVARHPCMQYIQTSPLRRRRQRQAQTRMRISQGSHTHAFRETLA